MWTSAALRTALSALGSVIVGALGGAARAGAARARNDPSRSRVAYLSAQMLDEMA
jgi:hypothetical protein